MPEGSCDPPPPQCMGPLQRSGSDLHTFLPLQVLHKVMVVASLQRVPEEHDVRSEVQTLQVLARGGAGTCPL